MRAMGLGVCPSQVFAASSRGGCSSYTSPIPPSTATASKAKDNEQGKEMREIKKFMKYEYNRRQSIDSAMTTLFQGIYHGLHIPSSTAIDTAMTRLVLPLFYFLFKYVYRNCYLLHFSL